MKTFMKVFVTLLLLTIFSAAHAQNLTVILDYMKVEPGNNGKYLEVEKEWRKIHEARVQQGTILFWELFEKVWSGADDPYQYITIAVYDDFKKSENPIPFDWIMDNFSQDERDDLMKKTMESRTLVKTEVYHSVTAAENAKTTKYIVFNTMKVKQENAGAYRRMETEIFKPLQEAAIEAGYRSGWSVWSKWPRPVDDFQFITVDNYSEYGQWNTGEDLLESVHPDKSWSEIYEMVSKTRKHHTSEVWRLLDVVAASEE